MAALDKVRNRIRGSKGRTKKTVGRTTGDRPMEARGKGEQVSGDLKQSGENVKDAFKK
jgi:uncharacterized protein YjbJ (UPF0337 family)